MKKQTCNFCENPESILYRETCCSGCSKIVDAYPYQPERSKREDVISIDEYHKRCAYGPYYDAVL